MQSTAAAVHKKLNVQFCTHTYVYVYIERVKSIGSCIPIMYFANIFALGEILQPGLLKYCMKQKSNTGSKKNHIMGKMCEA